MGVNYHAIDRALERYGLAFTALDMDNINHLAPRCEVVRERDDGAAISALAYGGQTIYPVWHPTRGVLTFITAGMARGKRRKRGRRKFKPEGKR